MATRTSGCAHTRTLGYRSKGTRNNVHRHLCKYQTLRSPWPGEGSSRSAIRLASKADGYRMPKKSTLPVKGLSERSERVIQRSAATAVFVLALAAAVLSFNGLLQLALEAGFDTNIAWLLPVIVDGMVLTGSLGVVAANLVGAGTWYSWLLTIVGVGISVAGNVAAAPDNLVAQLVHAIAPLTFALSVEGMLKIYRIGATAAAQRYAEEQAAEDRKAEREARSLERAAKVAAAREAASRAVTVTVPAPVAPIAPVVIPATVASSVPAAAVVSSLDVAPSQTQGLSAKDQLRELLTSNPDISGGEAARRLAIDPSYARKLLRELRPAEKTVAASEASEVSGEVVDASTGTTDPII